MSIEFLRKLCSRLPGTTEDIKWGNDLCFCVAGKMYCVTALDGPFKTSFKSDDEDFVTLTERDHFIPAPYLARNKWVMAEKSSALTKKEWEFFIRKSYDLIAAKLPKKVQREIGFMHIGKG
jgi:predicted DNA-binding protein (MmcQ/YjbR family)